MLKLLRAAAVIVALATPASAWAEPPLWVIRDADSTIVLFGSVHVLPKVDWRPRGLDAAMKRADDVWFEIPLDSRAKDLASREVLRRGPLPAGQTLSGLLDPALRVRLARVATSLGVDRATLERARPWMADLILSQTFVEKRGASASAGVETVLYAEIPKGAQVRAFETGEGQVAMLADMPQAAQIAGLAETLRQIGEEPESFNEIVGYWTRGDVARLASEALDPIRSASPIYYDVLITRRNADWVKQIKARLAGSGETLMVVGAGHLVGPDSVPAMLRKEGVKVEGP